MRTPTIKLLALCLFFVFLSLPHIASAALTDNIVAYWKFDEGSGNTTADATGNGYTGSLTSTAWITGFINDALQFNGSSSRVNVPSTPTLQSFTISAWVNPQSLPSRAEIADLGSLFLNLQSGKPSIYIDGVSTAYLQASAIPTNTYSLLTATWDGTTLKLYTNGVLSASQSRSGTAISTCTNQETIGIESIAGGCASYNAPFQGDIDEVGLWSRALSSSEVSELYASDKGLQYPFTTSSSVSRTIRLFSGFRLKLVSGKLVLYGM